MVSHGFTLQGLWRWSNWISGWQIWQADALGKEKYNVLKKARVGQIYLQLPLIKVFMSLIPISYSSPTILVPKTVASTLTPSGGWQTSGEYVACPIYDHDVVVHLMYCTVVTTLMAYTSYHNMKSLDSSWEDLFRLFRRLVQTASSLDVHSYFWILSGWVFIWIYIYHMYTVYIQYICYHVHILCNLLWAELYVQYA